MGNIFTIHVSDKWLSCKIQSELLKIHQGGQASDWKKIFTKDMADKGQLSKIYKELLKQ